MIQRSNSKKPVVLTFAATDPSSGAGLQADILTIAAMGAYPLSVVTAITVQDTHGVERIQPVDASLVRAQATTILADIPIDALKLGVLGSVENIRAIAELMEVYPEVPLVVDPVLASGRGDSLASEVMVEAYRQLLFPRTTVLLPNSLEARQLAASGNVVTALPNRYTLVESVAQLLRWGCQYVLLTGSHEPTPEVINTLYSQQGEVSSATWERLPGEYHGSGCILASAVATALAFGMPMLEAVQCAQQFTWQALRAGLQLDKKRDGQCLPDRVSPGWITRQGDLI